MKTMKTAMTTVMLMPSVFALFAASAATAQNRAEPKDEEVMGYFLPKTAVTVVLTQRLAKCPDAANAPLIVTQTSIVPIGVADQFVKVDTRSGLFANRSTKITTRSNGTIETFNAKAEGRGGEILGAVSKLAFSLVGMSVNIPPITSMATPSTSEQLKCSDDVTALLTALAAKNKQIADIEERITKDGATDNDLPFLDRLQAQATRIKNALTLSTQMTFDPLAGDQHLDRVAYERWFNKIPSGAEVMGVFGFKISVKADANSPNYQMPNSAGTQSKLSNATSNLIFRRPVSVKITVAPCAMTIASTCTLYDGNIDAEDMTTVAVVPAAQYSKLFSLRIGKGGIFGSRQAAAKFDEFGTPLEMDYGSTSGAAEMASVVDTVREGATTLDGAELSTLKEQIELEKARQELAELRDPEGDGG